MFRLAINVSVTRLILLHGDAGHMVEAFGDFVVGGNVVVGLIIFLILVVIQFVVVTNGAGRVSEVAARFTLDAMPGKQMAIDADLNAGQISDDEARVRREEISKEAEFYGAMDGASKFVKGDAIAAVVITAINLIGGIIVGVAQQGMSMGEAAQTFSLLTVGDGLAAQIPALLVSVATGIIVTRSASEKDLGNDIAGQIAKNRKAPMVAGVGRHACSRSSPACRRSRSCSSARCSSSWAGAEARRPTPTRGRRGRGRRAAQPPTRPPRCPRRATPRSTRSPSTRSSSRSASASCRSSTRRPAARCSAASARCAASSPPTSASSSRRCASTTSSRSTRTSTSCASAAPRSPARASRRATSSRWIRATRSASSPGLPTTEPAFGLPAVWIPEAGRAEAEALGYTVVDAESVIVTHLTETIRAHAADLLTRQETRQLLDQLKEHNAAVVEEVVPDVLSVGEIQRVLQALLRENVSVRDLGPVVEAVGDKARLTRDPSVLAEYARQALARRIVAPYVDAEGALRAIALDPTIEREIADAIAQTPDGEVLAMDPTRAQALVAVAAGPGRPRRGHAAGPALLEPRAPPRPPRSSPRPCPSCRCSPTRRRLPACASRPSASSAVSSSQMEPVAA